MYYPAPARQAMIRLLDGIGAGKRLRQVKGWLEAHGILTPPPYVPPEAFTACCADVIQILRKRGQDEGVGDYLEFGVSRGTSLACMHEALVDAGLEHVRLFGFDSFEGLPPEAAEESWTPGAYWSALPVTQHFLTQRGVDWGRVVLVKGWFKDTLTEALKAEHRIVKASLIMVDCDIYSAACDALRFAAPLIRDHAVLFFDDWASGPGEERAFREFLEAHPEFTTEELGTYSPNARVFLICKTRI